MPKREENILKFFPPLHPSPSIYKFTCVSVIVTVVTALAFDETFAPRHEFLFLVPLSRYDIHASSITSKLYLMVGSFVVIRPRDVSEQGKLEHTVFILGMHQCCQHLSEATFLKTYCRIQDVGLQEENGSQRLASRVLALKN